MNIRLIKGDITKLAVDGIVNAANSSLLGGGGVDGAIHRAGGPQIQAECMNIRERQGGCATGEAVITSAGKLPSKFVIHTVGPVWRGGNNRERELLANAYKNSLLLAVENNIKALAFPNISTGIYGFPKNEAAEIAIREVRLFLGEDHPVIKEAIFCCFDEENYLLYKTLLV